MTKKEFIALADVLRYNKPIGSTIGQSAVAEGFEQGHLAHWNRMVEVLADFCRAQNSRFDHQRWIGYIDGTNGPNGGTR